MGSVLFCLGLFSLPLKMLRTSGCCLGVALLFCTVATGARVPAQFVYSAQKADHERVGTDGCVIKSWKGTDQYGMSGYPSVTTINCSANASGFDREGVVV